MAQPDISHLGRFNLSPILLKTELINSIGQTMHQIRPQSIEIIIMIGHQYDHTIKFARLKFRRYFKNTLSPDEAIKPITIRPASTKRFINLKLIGNQLL